MTIASTIISPALEAYLESVSIEKPENLLHIFETGTIFNKKEMQISWLQASFIKLLINMINAKNILEIGTFVGFSASVFAEAISSDGEVITCENDLDFYNQSLTNFSNFEHGNKIFSKFGDAKEIICEPYINEKIFDIIFIDGDKENYSHYFYNLKNNLRQGGLFIVDNTLFKGEVICDGNQSKYAVEISKLNKLFFNSKEFQISQITLGDGMLVAIKK